MTRNSDQSVGRRNPARAKIDWHEAFLFYAGLAPERRRYQAVADHYADVGLSVRSVERRGRDEHWRDKARRLDEAAAADAAARLRDQRTDRLVDADHLAEASLAAYEGQLSEGRVKLTAADLVRLHKLRASIREGAARDPREPVMAAVPPASTEHKLAVLRALEEAGVLQRLLERDQPQAASQSSTDEPGERGEL